MLAFVQIVSPMSFNLSIKFPPLFDKLLNALAFLGFDFLPNLALECYMPSFDYCQKVLTVTVMPLVVLFIMATVGAIHTYFRGKHLWGIYIYVALVFTFLIFLNCSTTCFHYIKCDYIYDIDDSFLVMDYPNVKHVIFLFESYRHNL